MEIIQLSEKVKTEDEIVSELLRLSEEFKGKIVYSTSFGYEAQVITHIIFKYQIPIRVLTIDTGRHFPETLALKEEMEQKYGQKIEVIYPNAQKAENLVNNKGYYSFYESVENRKECCHIRKIAPIEEVMKDVDCWITGIRADQSINRLGMEQKEWNEKFELIKFHPLFHWTWEEVKEYVKENDIPYNSLHDKGFPSIGCQPCTRAIKPGEDFRAGRWWWEEQGVKKECGLHQ